MKRIQQLLLLLTIASEPTRALSSNPVLRRRAFLVTTTTSSCLIIAPSLQNDNILTANSAFADTGETIRRGAANLPGYGPADVYFPKIFKGKWNVMEEETVQGRNMEYEIRFISSIESGLVIADRGYNEAARVKAAAAAAIATIPDDTKTSTIRSYEWAETNPNDLRLALEDGSRKEIKVTKRASPDRTDDFVSSSEVRRITFEQENSATGLQIPVISAQRVLTKWKAVNDTNIEGLEIVYDIGGGGGDPLSGFAPSSEPQVISKSRLHLRRIQ